MAKSNKLQNIKAVKEMIAGTHKFQTKKTIEFTDAKQKAEKKCPILSSWPVKLAILPGMKDLRPIKLNLKINSNMMSRITIKKITDHVL